MRIDAVGRADLVECVKNVVEGIDRHAGLRVDRTAAEIGEHAARTPHRPGREAESIGLFLGNKFRRAHECVPVVHLAVREGEALNEPVAVEQVRFAQTATLEQAGAVAIKRTLQVARNFAFDVGRFVAPALLRHAEKIKAPWCPLRSVTFDGVGSRHCHDVGPLVSILTSLR